ncbi:hypothetical protein OW763_13440 [Clostridium aestuarii]|uniref:Uncharacterized protein n=1 Tax=Clostridium aestuarii TaxID=338193 RepID=A0ABT4D265_9CLOT|nr:hypothetical protein [Clostridium aestuarii]MCY6485336.1 hypothetical protein [Clostridium aestuarii]
MKLYSDGERYAEPESVCDKSWSHFLDSSGNLKSTWKSWHKNIDGTDVEFLLYDIKQPSTEDRWYYFEYSYKKRKNDSLIKEYWYKVKENNITKFNVNFTTKKPK